MKNNYTTFAGLLKLLSVCVVLMTVYGCNDDDDDNQINNQGQVQTLSTGDRDFIINAAYANRAEIELGALAVSQGTHDSVVAFGQRMVNEHSLAQTELKTLAANSNITIPDTLDAIHKALKSQLATYNGMQFDTLYINSQIVDHQASIQLFQNEINQGQSQDAKNYALKYLPHIQMHYQKAVQIKPIVKANQ
jgi:putative membrane protein